MDYSTNTNFLGLTFSLLMAALLLVLPRKYATIPIFLTACFMTNGQRIDIAGLNFYMLRILILVGLARSFFRKEISFLKLNTIDKAMIIWVTSNVIIYTLLRLDSGAFINRLGYAFNILGLYFLFRFLIQDFSEVERVFKYLSVILVLTAVAISVEYFTGKNIFAIFGGVDEISSIRFERIRCKGAFRHPILAGTFGAIFMPLSALLWFDKKNSRLFAIVVFIAATFIVFASGSSGPVVTYLVVLIGLLIWPLREYLKVLTIAGLSALIMLHILMKAPVWFLIAKLSDFFGGGTGYYRSKLINVAIKRFDEWWLLGTDYTAHWMPRTLRIDPTMVDITNTYIRQGVDGGLLTLILFVLVIILCFSSIGKSLSAIEKQPFAMRLTVWSMGTMLFAHCVTFLSVTYYDQIIVFWYMLLAMISISSSLALSVGYAGSREL